MLTVCLGVQLNKSLIISTAVVQVQFQSIFINTRCAYRRYRGLVTSWRQSCLFTLHMMCGNFIMKRFVRSALPSVYGVGITSLNLGDAVEEILELSQAGTPSSVFTLNLDHVVKLRRDPKFRLAYSHANVVTADGWPVAWVARRQNAPVERTTGADLVLPLIDRAAESGVPVFLLGSTANVLGRAGREFVRRSDGRVNIAGSLAPSKTVDAEGVEAEAAIEQIRKSGAKICFVALGAPKQELFSELARKKGLCCCMVCIGAALDFIAGEQVRAPQVLRDRGLEWAWRLAGNPRRLARRYFDSAVMFAYLAMSEMLKPKVNVDMRLPPN